VIVLLYSICFFVLVCFGVLASKQLPLVYEAVKANVLEQNKSLESEKIKVKVKSVIAILFSLTSLPIYYFTSDIKLSVFVFIFSCVAYTDLVIRWVPDVLIYCMVWISVFGINQTLQDGIVSVALFCFPAALLYLVSYIKNGRGCIASGDWYVFPAVGIWIAPEYAALVMMISIGVALITSRFMKNVPFLTCIFPVFLGGQLCEVFLVY
jgi:hypothetical protein